MKENKDLSYSCASKKMSWSSWIVDKTKHIADKKKNKVLVNKALVKTWN